MINTGEVAGLIKALGGGASSSEISEAVSNYIDDHPELVTTVQDGSITYAKLDSSLKEKADDVSDLKNEISILEPSATSSDVGKALIVKTVSGGKVTAYEFGEAGGGGTDIGLSIVNGKICVTYEEVSA